MNQFLNLFFLYQEQRERIELIILMGSKHRNKLLVHSGLLSFPILPLPFLTCLLLYSLINYSSLLIYMIGTVQYQIFFQKIHVFQKMYLFSNLFKNSFYNTYIFVPFHSFFFLISLPRGLPLQRLLSILLNFSLSYYLYAFCLTDFFSSLWHIFLITMGLLCCSFSNSFP